MLLTANSIPTDTRARHIRNLQARISPQGDKYKCYLCDNYSDDIRHVYGDCIIVEETLRKIMEEGDRDREIEQFIEKSTLVYF